MGRSTGGRSRRLDILVASMQGIAARYAHMRRLDHDPALAELRTRMGEAGVTAGQETELLSRAAALYVGQDDSSWSSWAPAAVDLLCDAGADRTRAEQLAQPRIERLRARRLSG